MKLKTNECNKIYTENDLINIKDRLIGDLNHLGLKEMYDDINYLIPNNNSDYLLITDESVYNIHFFKETSKLNQYLKISLSSVMKAFRVKTSFGITILVDCYVDNKQYLFTWLIGSIYNELADKICDILNRMSSYNLNNEGIIHNDLNKIEKVTNDSLYTNSPGRKGAIKKAYKEYPDWFNKTYDEKLEEITNKNEVTQEIETDEGSNDSKINFCPSCGTKINPNFKFCPSCGYAVKESTDSNTNSSSSQEEMNDKEPYNIYNDGYKQQETPYSFTPKPQSPKHQYKANKKAGIVSCPKCGSQSITTTNKKLSVGRGIGGTVVGAPLAGVTGGVSMAVGAVAGGLSSKKIYNVCMNCGHKWKP